MFKTKERPIFKIVPVLKDYIWGGGKLKALKYCNKFDKIAESWEVSTHPAGECGIQTGSGHMPLKEKAGEVPFIVKYIDAADDLSVQVHPGDEYARKKLRQKRNVDYT